jgi:hypothetical protein
MEVDQNVGVYLTEASLADVTAAVRPLAAGVETNVLGRDLPTATEWTFVFRFNGHAWTTVLRNALSPQVDDAVRAVLVELSPARRRSSSRPGERCPGRSFGMPTPSSANF